MGADTCRSIIKFRHFNRHPEDRTSLGLSMPTRRSLLTTQLDRLGRSKVTELCSRTGTELDLADQTLVVVSISTPVGQIPFSVPQIASRLTRCACCLASRSDRTSSELPEASSILMTYSREAYTELELVTKVMSVTTVARFLDWMLHCLLRFMAQVKRSNRHLCAS